MVAPPFLHVPHRDLPCVPMHTSCPAGTGRCNQPQPTTETYPDHSLLCVFGCQRRREEQLLVKEAAESVGFILTVTVQTLDTHPQRASLAAQTRVLCVSPKASTNTLGSANPFTSVGIRSCTCTHCTPRQHPTSAATTRGNAWPRYPDNMDLHLVLPCSQWRVVHLLFLFHGAAVAAGTRLAQVCRPHVAFLPQCVLQFGVVRRRDATQGECGFVVTDRACARGAPTKAG